MIPTEIQGEKLNVSDSAAMWRLLRAQKFAMPQLATFRSIGRIACKVDGCPCEKVLVLQEPIGTGLAKKHQRVARIFVARRDIAGDWHFVRRGAQHRDLGEVLALFKKRHPALAKGLFPRFA